METPSQTFIKYDFLKNSLLHILSVIIKNEKGDGMNARRKF